MTDHHPPQPGRRVAPDAVWAEVREAYLSGLSAPACCKRHGVGLSALRERAAREGWRRADQPWRAPNLDPDDEGARLEESVDGDLDLVDLKALRFVCERRAKRAILRGDGVEAMRWRRIGASIRDDQEHIWEKALIRHAFGDQADLPPHPDDPDASDASDGVFPPPG